MVENKTILSKTPAPSSLYWEDISYFSKNYLLLMSLIRIIISVIILFFTDITPYLKILFIILLDSIDCNFINVNLIYKEKTFCQSGLYQRTDKLVDLFLYFLIFIYFFNNNFYSTTVNMILLILFCFRLVGMWLYEKTKKRKYLFYFPNLTPELIVILLLFLSYPKIFNNKEIKITLIILTIVFKFVYELILHYNKNDSYVLN